MVDYMLYKLCFGVWFFVYCVSDLFYVFVYFFGGVSRVRKIDSKLLWVLYKLCFGLWSFVYRVSSLFYKPVYFFGVRCGKIKKEPVGGLIME